MPKCPFCEKVISEGTEACPYCNAPITVSEKPQADDDLEQRVRALLDDGQKIEAVKLYREATGASLLDAKNAVEALETGKPLPVQEGTVDGDLEQRVQALLDQNRERYITCRLRALLILGNFLGFALEV